MDRIPATLPEVVQILETVEKLHGVDSYSAGHCWRVSDYSHILGEMLGISGLDLFYLFLSAVVHDIGKLSVPSEYLQKPGRLTPEERVIVEKHATFGTKELASNPLISFIKDGILQHHERVDGNGYPFKLIGSEISIQGKIIAVADVFDALTSKRPYRDPMKQSEAMAFLKLHSGTHFDPEIVKLFSSIPQEKFEMITQKIGDSHPLSLIEEGNETEEHYSVWNKVTSHPDFIKIIK